MHLVQLPTRKTSIRLYAANVSSSAMLRMVRAECGVVGPDPPPFRLTTTFPLTNAVSTIGRLTFAAGIPTGR
jgi:hypothetical protein